MLEGFGQLYGRHVPRTQKPQISGEERWDEVYA